MRPVGGRNSPDVEVAANGGEVVAFENEESAGERPVVSESKTTIVPRETHGAGRHRGGPHVLHAARTASTHSSKYLTTKNLHLPACQHAHAPL